MVNCSIQYPGQKWRRHRGRFVCVVGVFMLLAAVGVLVFPRQAAFAKAGVWPTYMGGNDRTGFNQAETVINPQTAPNLKMHWKHLAGGKVTAQPVVANGLLYWGSWDGLEHASDPATGNDVWTANLGQTPITCSGVQQGVLSTATVSTLSLGGVKTPVLFVGGGDVQFYALNANTGAVIWQTRLGTQPDYFLYSSPLVYKGSIYIGVSGHNDCPLVLGQFVKLNAVTGAVQATFNTVPNGCTGASVWGAPALDSATGTLYFATGNPYNCASPETMAEALIALHASDLSLVGSWQVPANEVTTDGDFGSTPTLFSATINGVLHQMLGLVNKNGIYYAFDRATISAGPLWEVRLAAPTMHEESNISSSAWDGTTLYAAAASTTINGTSCGGSLRALNPATGAFLWEDCLPSDVLGPVTMVPGVIEVGTHGLMFVMDAMTGQQLFSFQDKTVHSNFLGPGCIANGMLYHGNTDGYLYAFGM